MSKANDKGRGRNRTSRPAPEGITADSLMRRKFPPPRFVIPHLLPAGLTVLASKPKVGKSWWCLAASLAVSNGSRFMGIRVTQGEVLYLALEDAFPRLRARLSVLLGTEQPNGRLHFHVSWPRLDEGGLEALSDWLREHRRTRLVVIDTLARLRPRRSRSSYLGEYEILAALKGIADRCRVGLVAVYHLRKALAPNWTDEIHGTSAVSGAADALLHLSRPRNTGEGTLNVTGRDIEERQLPLRFRAGRWELIEAKPDEFVSPERRRILKFVASSSEPVSPKLVAESLALNPNSTRRLMAAMRRYGLLVRVVGGYVVPGADRGSGRSKRSPRTLPDARAANLIPFRPRS